jgi:hypothetical protein
MQRSPYKPVQLGHAVFQDRAPVSPSIYLSAAVLFLGYPLLAVLLGQTTRDQAFVTAFMAALSVRIVQDFEPMLRRILTWHRPVIASLSALSFVGIPLVLLAFSAEPLSCQRLQSAFFLVIAAAFLSDFLNDRVTVAKSLWPQAAMTRHLPALTRLMVIYNLAFLVLNEALIHTVTASNWLLFWAVLPLLCHAVLRALVQGVVTQSDSGQPV